jgi:hypothetical protein
LSAVRWGVAGNIVVAWILTLPASALAAGIAYVVISPFLCDDTFTVGSRSSGRPTHVSQLGRRRSSPSSSQRMA